MLYVMHEIYTWNKLPQTTKEQSTLGQSPGNYGNFLSIIVTPLSKLLSSGNYGNFLSIIVTPLSKLLREIELFPRISGAGQHCSRREEVLGPERWERGQGREWQG